MNSWKLVGMLACAAALGVPAGCQHDYRECSAKLDKALMCGDMAHAGDLAYAGFKGCGEGHDHVVYAMDAGPVLLMNGRGRESAETLASAYDYVRPYLDTKAEASVSSGAAQLALNQTVATYRGTPVERILLNTMLAVNRLQAGDNAAARVELNRAEDWQKDAEARYAKAIEEDKDKATKKAKAQGIDLGAVMQNKELKDITEGLEDATEYAAFQSPWTSYLRAVFLLATGDAVGDRGTARSELRRVWEMCPECRPMVETDLVTAESGAASPTTWVFVMSGLSPRQEERKVRVPIPVGRGNFVYVVAAFPWLVPVGAFNDSFEVSGGGRASPAVLLMDVDRNVKAEYKQRIAGIIAQELASSGIKAVGAYVLRESVKDNSFAFIAVAAAGVIAQEVSTSADLRIWRTLPKRIYIARVPSPADGKIVVSARGGPSVTVDVDSKGSNGVLVWQTQTGAPGMSSTSWRMAP